MLLPVKCNIAAWAIINSSLLKDPVAVATYLLIKITQSSARHHFLLRAYSGIVLSDKIDFMRSASHLKFLQNLKVPSILILKCSLFLALQKSRILWGSSHSEKVSAHCTRNGKNKLRENLSDNNFQFVGSQP